jgi:hypothetical protein
MRWASAAWAGSLTLRYQSTARPSPWRLSLVAPRTGRQAKISLWPAKRLRSSSARAVAPGCGPVAHAEPVGSAL